MAGTVWKIEKNQGDSVVAGEVLLILESMKMEIPVESPCAGTLQRIAVEEGQGVSEGSLLAVVS